MGLREWTFAGGQFVKDGAHAQISVRRSAKFAAQLLRRHVRQCPGDLLGTGQACRSREIAFRMDKLGQSEIEDLEASVAVGEDWPASDRDG